MRRDRRARADLREQCAASRAACMGTSRSSAVLCDCCRFSTHSAATDNAMFLCDKCQAGQRVAPSLSRTRATEDHQRQTLQASSASKTGNYLTPFLCDKCRASPQHAVDEAFVCDKCRASEQCGQKPDQPSQSSQPKHIGQRETYAAKHVLQRPPKPTVPKPVLETRETATSTRPAAAMSATADMAADATVDTPLTSGFLRPVRQTMSAMSTRELGEWHASKDARSTARPSRSRPASAQSFSSVEALVSRQRKERQQLASMPEDQGPPLSNNAPSRLLPSTDGGVRGLDQPRPRAATATRRSVSVPGPSDRAEKRNACKDEAERVQAQAAQRDEQLCQSRQRTVERQHHAEGVRRARRPQATERCHAQRQHKECQRRQRAKQHRQYQERLLKAAELLNRQKAEDAVERSRQGWRPRPWRPPGPMHADRHGGCCVSTDNRGQTTISTGLDRPSPPLLHRMHELGIPQR